MIVTVKCEISREHLVWAAAYLKRTNKVKGRWLSKKDVLAFLRSQLSMFGSDHCFTDDWQYDHRDQVAEAEKWVSARFPWMSE